MKATAAITAFFLMAIAAAPFARGAQNPGGGTVYSHPKCKYLCKDPKELEQDLPPLGPIPPPPQDNTTRAYDWSIVLLNLIRTNFDTLTPPAISRILGVFATCLHDAIAQPTLGMKPVYTSENDWISDIDIASAVDGAAHQTLVATFGGDEGFEGVEGLPFQATRKLLMSAMPPPEYSPSYYVGVKRCKKVIAAFTADGFSVAGKPLPGTPPPTYMPVNLNQSTAGIADCAKEIKSLDHWQPLCVPTKEDPSVCEVQTFASPQADIWTTYALATGDAVRPKPPPLRSVDQKEWERQAMEVVEFSGNLSDVSKVTAEHWADGPDTTAPAGHFFRIAMEAGIFKELDLVNTVKLYFLVGNALNDAGVAAWDAKIFYDFVRPITMVQCGFPGQTLHAWKAPYMGVGDVDASVWQPYQAITFVTPAFSGYVSGHSTFSAAGAGILRLLFGDEYIAPKCRRFGKGNSLYEKEISDPDAEGFIDGVTNVPNTGPDTIGYTPGTDVVLCWDTWVSSVKESGISRLQGGIHIIADDTDGQIVGYQVADLVYEKATASWEKARLEAMYAES